MNEHEIVAKIKEYIDSKDFEHKFILWTNKLCKELILGYMKPILIVSSIFLSVITVMFSFIFDYFHDTIKYNNEIIDELTKSVIRLENKIEFLSDRKYDINKK